MVLRSPFGPPSVQQTRLPGLCLPPPVRLEQRLGSPLPVGRVGQKPAISLTTEIARTPAVATHMSVECVWARILPSGVRSDSSVIGFHPLPSSIVSPLHVDRLTFLLRDHPQPDIVSYVVSGFVHGFDIGFMVMLVRLVLGICYHSFAIQVRFQWLFQRKCRMVTLLVLFLSPLWNPFIVRL